jgi:TolB-like protein
MPVDRRASVRQHSADEEHEYFSDGLTEEIVAADGTHLWSERYDREVEDLFARQNDIAAAIAAELQLKFSPDTAPIRAGSPTSRPTKPT